MHSFINSPFKIGSLQLPHRLIQGPLAGYSCAPFRRLFGHYQRPAYCVSEMLSAYDVLYKDRPGSRFLFRDPSEGVLTYQLAGNTPDILSAAAQKLESIGADCIDINCGCPKRKIRKKGAGSALLANPAVLIDIITAIKTTIRIPLTVKIRLHGSDQSLELSQMIYNAGADAIIVHGRFSSDDYDTPCQWDAIARIKQSVPIPVIANGDIQCTDSLKQAIHYTGCDAYMIGRAGTGQPWLYQELLTGTPQCVSPHQRIQLFMEHIQGLAKLENETKAMLQSKSLLRYYFRSLFPPDRIQTAMNCHSLLELEQTLMRFDEITCIM